MAAEWTAYDDKNERAFELGKGAWGRWDGTAAGLGKLTLRPPAFGEALTMFVHAAGSCVVASDAGDGVEGREHYLLAGSRYREDAQRIGKPIGLSFLSAEEYQETQARRANTTAQIQQPPLSS